jgi:thioredoxin reductase (NADPH)
VILVSKIRNVVILGSGPAGYTAALYAARANLRPLLLTGLHPGGQLVMTTEVENYPGFRDGIMGPELMTVMREQVARFGTEILDLEAESVDLSQRPFLVKSGDRSWRTHALIIATGATAKLLGLPSEQAFMGFGVSACATCDGFFFRGRRVTVVGGGDTALEEAIYLSKLASEVVVVHRRDALRASKIMQERAFANPKIRFVWDTEVEEVVGLDAPARKVTTLKLRNLRTHAVTEHETDGLFVAIGHQPNTAFLGGQLPMNKTGYLLVEPGTARTMIEGVYAAGDVADPVYRQAVTAAGTGCMAAIDAERWLEEKGLTTHPASEPSKVS